MAFNEMSSPMRPTIWENLLGVELTQGYVDAKGIRTRFLRAGRPGAVPLVLLHGTTGHVETYARNIRAHAEHFDVIALDMLGHGFTDKPETGYEIIDYAQHVADTLDALGLDTVLLSGQSLGGWVAARFTLLWPHRVRRLCLNTTGGAHSDPGAMKSIREKTIAAAENPTPEVVRKRLEFLMADPPSKVRNLDEDHLHATSVTSHLLGALATARTSVFISSPYLIPREKGMDALLNLTNRKVRVSILTNSMAANDSVYAHAGYARYRRKMLEAGVELYEISPALIGGNGRSKLRSGPALSHGRLHAKTVVIDQQTVFIGSMNLDPRSADKNTELGIFIDSPELALQVLAVLDANRLGVALALGWFLLRSIHPRSSRWRGVEAWPASAAPCAHSARVRSPRPGLLQMISLGRSLRGLWDA